MWVLLLLSAACAQDTDIPVATVDDTSMAGPMPQEDVPLPAEAPAPDQVAERARDVSLQAGGLAFFLEDRKALAAGELPDEWELPPLEVYREEPWCHAPEAHGRHIPYDVEHPALLEQQHPILLDMAPPRRR